MDVSDFKQFVVFIRRVPVIIAGASFLNTLLFILNIDTIWLSFLCGSSFLFIFVMWKLSKLFKLCVYHKLCLIYSIIMEVINLYDYIFGIPLTWNAVCYLFFFLSFIVLVSVLILKKFKI